MIHYTVILLIYNVTNILVNSTVHVLFEVWDVRTVKAAEFSLSVARHPISVWMFSKKVCTHDTTWWEVYNMPTLGSPDFKFACLLSSFQTAFASSMATTPISVSVESRSVEKGFK